MAGGNSQGLGESGIVAGGFERALLGEFGEFIEAAGGES